MKHLNMLPRIFHRDVRMACALSREKCQDYNCEQLRAERASVHWKRRTRGRCGRTARHLQHNLCRTMLIL